MSTEYFSYRRLDVYQKSKDFVIFIYRLLKQFPKEEQYALCDQLRRAAVSIPSNIAEGMGRVSIKEQIHFIEIAFGSLNEVMCQLELACDLSYLTQEQLAISEDFAKDLIRMLSRLRKIREAKL
ncbi:MAG: four helix bundle protein [Bacteroidaceae bacterium]|nr:four helix bundle protein [Bacteroidaceae bacterium]